MSVFSHVVYQGCDNLSLSDHLLRAVLNLLRREVSEHGRHLQQYFNLFVMYANLGKKHTAITQQSRTSVLQLIVQVTFMQFLIFIVVQHLNHTTKTCYDSDPVYTWY